MPRLVSALIAEVIGTFALCFIGIMAINSLAPAGAAGLIGIALAHGLALATMITALGYLSGGHFNPAVTIGILIVGKIKPAAAVAYIAAQLVGGILAGLLVIGITTSGDAVKPVVNGTPAIATISANDADGKPVNVPALSSHAATHAEMIATFFLMMAVLGAAVDPRGNRTAAGFVIGLTVAMDILAIGPLTGAAMNPARAFGPAIAATMYQAGSMGNWWEHCWTYILGPVIGAAIAALVYRFLLAPKAETPAA